MPAPAVPTDATIIVLTKNGLPTIRRVLDGIFRQTVSWRFDVLVIDSGSTDGTLQVLESYPLQVLKIPPSDFSHSGTRNFAAQMARGHYVVYLVQDAIPYDEQWLDSLVRPCRAGDAAASYSREMPHSECSPMTLAQMSLRCECHGGSICYHRLVKSTPLRRLPPSEQMRLAEFRNTSSCIQRSVLLDYPFPPVRFGEDIAWARLILEAGYTIAYVPSSIVYHSHERSPWYEFKRAYVGHKYLWVLFGYGPPVSPGRLVRTVVWSTLFYWKAVLSSRGSVPQKLSWSLMCPALSVGRYLGQYCGMLTARYRLPVPDKLDRFLCSGV